MSMREEVKVVFTALNSQLTRLDVSRNTSPFGLTLDTGAFAHTLGYRDAPLYRFEQPASPTNDPWIFRPDAAGRFIPTQQDFEQGLDPAYLARFEGSGVCQGFELPWLLPSGSYLMVQSTRRPRASREMLMGNCWVPATPNVRTLSTEGEEARGYVFGADSQRPPSFDQPLLGFVLLDSNGHEGSEQVFFFNLFEPLPGAELPGQDSMLIVPMTGELVFYNYRNPGDDWRCPSADEWRESLVHDFASWCTTPFV